MAAWYVSLFLVTRIISPTLMIRNMRSTQNISISCGSVKPVPLTRRKTLESYRVLDNSYYVDGSHSLTKSITLKAGKNISYQIQHHRSEVWTFVGGEGIFSSVAKKEE